MVLKIGEKIEITDTVLLDQVIQEFEKEYYLVRININDNCAIFRASGNYKGIFSLDTHYFIEPEERAIAKNIPSEKKSTHNQSMQKMGLESDLFLRQKDSLIYLKAPDFVFGIPCYKSEPNYLGLSQGLWHRRESSVEPAIRRKTNGFVPWLHIEKSTIDSIIVCEHFPKDSFIPQAQNKYLP